MDKYINLLTLWFILSWLIPFTGLQAYRGAFTHYMFYIECVTCLMMSYEIYREVLIVFFQARLYADPVRVWLYGTEHIFLGLVIREVLIYVETCKKQRRRRSRQIHRISRAADNG